MKKMLIMALAAAALLAPGAQAKHGPDDHTAAPTPAIVVPTGFAWEDAGVGAGVTALVLCGIGSGVALTFRHRRPARA